MISSLDGQKNARESNKAKEGSDILHKRKLYVERMGKQGKDSEVQDCEVPKWERQQKKERGGEKDEA